MKFPYKISTWNGKFQLGTANFNSERHRLDNQMYPERSQVPNGAPANYGAFRTRSKAPKSKEMLSTGFPILTSGTHAT